MVERINSREQLLQPEWQGLLGVINEFLGADDREFVGGLEFDEALGYVYGRLLNDGFDPDEVLEAAGVTQNEI